jgi:hypothetical protein
MAIIRYPSVSLSANGRVLLRGVGVATTKARMILTVTGTAPGCLISLQVSHHDEPDVGDDSQWATIADGLLPNPKKRGSCRVSGWWGDQVTKAATREPSRALPRRRALCTNWKKPR